MENLAEKTYMLLGRLSQITDLKELVELSCVLMKASLYIVDGQGNIIEHSDEGKASCQAWLNSLSEGRLNEAHRRVVLTPQITCNVIRDKFCKGDPCARLSIPVLIAGEALPGAVVFFLWDNDPSYEKQCLASILAGAISNLLQRPGREQRDVRRESVRLLESLMSYKPGMKLYFQNALKNSEFSSFDGCYRMFVVSPGSGGSAEAERLQQGVNALPGGVWMFEHAGYTVVVCHAEQNAPETMDAVEQIAAASGLQTCRSVGFDDLIKLRYVFEDTAAALKIASAAEPERSCHTSDRYLAMVFLNRCKEKLSAEEYYPDFFRRLVDYDEKTGKDYRKTLSAYLDNGRNTNAAAKQIYIHRNTMMQQLERIEQIMGVSLDDTEVCFFLQLCIRLYEPGQGQ